MPAAGMPTAFQHIHKPDQISVDISMRIDQRMAHAGLRSEMDDAREAMMRK